MKDFIDIHTHILPGLDDGPKSIEGSLEIARCYERTGIKRIIATPHYLPGTAWGTDKEKVLDSVRKLNFRIKSENINLRVHSGMEIGFHRKLKEGILEGKLLPLGTSKYYLIEPSFHGEQNSLLAALKSLLEKDQQLILAHPERADVFQKNLEMLEPLIRQGLRIQVNSGSLLGYFGDKSRETAEILRQKRWLHFIASDAHDHKRRPPLTPEEFSRLSQTTETKAMMNYCRANLHAIFS